MMLLFSLHHPAILKKYQLDYIFPLFFILIYSVGKLNHYYTNFSSCKYSHFQKSTVDRKCTIHRWFFISAFFPWMPAFQLIFFVITKFNLYSFIFFCLIRIYFAETSVSNNNLFSICNLFWRRGKHKKRIIHSSKKRHHH